jgi:putative transport protein
MGSRSTGDVALLKAEKGNLPMAALAGSPVPAAADVVALGYPSDPGPATIGTAMDSISRLDLPEDARSVMSNNIPVAFAVTYLIGLIGAAWFLSQIAPWLMRVNLAEECRKLEESLQGGGADMLTTRREFELRAYAVDPGSPWVGRGVPDLEASAGGRGSSSSASAARPGRRLQRRGRPSGQGRHRRLGAADGSRRGLRRDRQRSARGRRQGAARFDRRHRRRRRDEPLRGWTALADLGRDPEARSVFLRRITRAGMPLQATPGTTVQRGDVVTIVGSAASTARAVEHLGVADRPTDVTDMMVVATAIVAGALIGLPALHIGGVEIGLSLPVGVLLGGLICGWLRSVRPNWFGRIPGATLWVFESIGLAGFVAVVGLNAGPDFVRGLTTSGPSLVAAGAVTVTASLLVGVLLGRFVFKMHRACCSVCAPAPARPRPLWRPYRKPQKAQSPRSVTA